MNIFKELKSYKEYLIYYSTTLLRLKIAGSYLGVLWLFIEPLAFMLIYTFVVTVLFNSSHANFHLYVFVGLIAWQFMASTVLISTTVIVRNKAILDQVKFSKFVLPTTHTLVSLYQFLISTVVLIILILGSGVNLTWHIVEYFPITLVCTLFIYGLSLIVAHVGVYLFDIRNIIDIVLRFLFYLTPIMWIYSKVKLANIKYLRLNPMSVIIESYRNIFLDNKSADYRHLLYVLILSIVLISIGYLLIKKNENNYGKVL